LQKSVSVVTSLATALSLSGVAMLAPMAALAVDVVDGDLIRNPDAAGMAQFDIYIVKTVGDKNFKRLILSPHVFESYEHFDKNGNGNNWDDVMDVDQATMDQYTTSDLVRVISTDPVYRLHAEEGADTGTKYWLDMTASEFTAVFDADSIYTINSTDEAGYTAGANIADPSAAFPPAGVSEGTLTVTLAADTPAAGWAINSAARVQFTKVNFTATGGDVIIDSMKVERTGSPASDAALSGINILKPDNDLLSTSYKTLNSSHQATFTENITIANGTTASYVLVAKIGTGSYGGEVPKLSLVEVNLSGNATLNATLPITGNAMTINTTITIAALAIDEGPDVGTATKEVGTTDFDFVHVKLTNSASDADVQIESIKFNNVGSADDADVANMKLLYYNTSEVIATADMVSNYIYFDLSGCGDLCKIGKGKNKTYSLRGDIIGGSARTLDFDIKKVEHVVAKDLLNNVYVTPTGTSINYGNIIDISRGKLNVNKTDTVKTGNISADASDVELGSWNFRVSGESITISTIKFDMDNEGATASSTDFTNLVLTNKTTGETLTGGNTGVNDTTGGDGYVTFSDSFTLPIGDNEIILTGTINSDPTANDTIQFGVDFTAEANLDATGDNTGDAITIETTPAYATPNAEIDANKQNFKALALAVTTLSQPAAKTIAAGTSNIHYSTISFDASDSSEDVKVTQFKITLVTGAVAKANEIQNITFEVDGTDIGITKNGSESAADTDEQITVSLSGDEQFVVAKGTTVTMKVYADLASGATAGVTGTHRLQISSATSDTVTAIGATSGNDITETYSTATSNNVTVGTAGGTVKVSLDSNNPNASLVAAGTTGATLAAFNFYATSTEDVELDYLYLTEVTTDTDSTSWKDYDRIYFENEDGIEVAGMTPTSSFPKINFADDAFVVDIDDTDGAILYLKADLAAIGSGYNGTAGDYLGYEIAAAADVVAKGSLSGSGSHEYLASGASAPTGKTHYVYKSYPTFAKQAVGTNRLGNGTMDLYKFTVTANSSGDISLYKFTFDIATTVCNVTQLYVYDVTGTETVLNDTAGTCSASRCIFETDGSDWTTNFSGYEVVISKTQPRTFVLRGNIAGAATGAQVTTRVAGDASHISNAGATLMDAADDIAGTDVEDDFIWSDRSQGAHTYQTDDWTNGYLVSGLTASSSTAETIAY